MGAQHSHGIKTPKVPLFDNFGLVEISASKIATFELWVIFYFFLLKNFFLKDWYFFDNGWYLLVLFVLLEILKIFCQKTFFSVRNFYRSRKIVIKNAKIVEK